MSENTGPETINQMASWRLGSVGHPIHGALVKIDNPVDGEGEVREIVDNSSDESSTLWANKTFPQLWAAGNGMQFTPEKYIH